MTKPTRKTKAPHRSTGRRLTVEAQQEYRSRSQFDERLTEFGWLVNAKDRDHGEDVLVDIYDGGNSTGLSFLVQLKSTERLEAFVPKRATTVIAYTLDVKDILHWEVSAQMIVVVVWDVRKKHGVWLTVPEIVRQLDEDVRWRTGKSVRVKLPRSNGTDDASLHRLRRLTADRNLPIIQQGRSLEITPRFAFPKTTEGLEAARSLREALNYGEPARIDGKFITQFKMSDWWERLYGSRMPLEFRIESSPKLPDVPVRLEVPFREGVHARDLDLKYMKRGHRGFALSNAHREDPVDLQLVVKRQGDGASVSMNLSIRYPVPDIFRSRDATTLMLALHSGRVMRLVHRGTGKLIVEGPVPSSSTWPSVESLLAWQSLLEKLCFVQARLNGFGVVHITDGRVSESEALDVDDFYEICRTGTLERVVSFKMDVDLQHEGMRDFISRVRAGEPIEFTRTLPDGGEIDVLNVTVPLGPRRTRYPATAVVDQIERALDAGKHSVTVNVVDLDVREEYSNWAPTPSISDVLPEKQA
jgi:hypothetical protein